jgi:hypothetical protein
MVSSASQPYFEVLSAVDRLNQALAAVKWSQTCRIVARHEPWVRECRRGDPDIGAQVYATAWALLLNYQS